MPQLEAILCATAKILHAATKINVDRNKEINNFKNEIESLDLGPNISIKTNDNSNIIFQSTTSLS